MEVEKEARPAKQQARGNQGILRARSSFYIVLVFLYDRQEGKYFCTFTFHTFNLK